MLVVKNSEKGKETFTANIPQIPKRTPWHPSFDTFLKEWWEPSSTLCDLGYCAKAYKIKFIRPKESSCYYHDEHTQAYKKILRFKIRMIVGLLK